MIPSKDGLESKMFPRKQDLQHLELTLLSGTQDKIT